MIAARTRRILVAAHRFFENPSRHTATHIGAALLLALAVGVLPLAADHWPTARTFIGTHTLNLWNRLYQEGGESMRTRWHDHDVLVHLTHGDPLTLENVTRGLAIFGGPGSSKSTAAVPTLALPMLTHGYGGLFLCTSAGDAAKYMRLAALSGRSRDVVHVHFGGEARCNLLKFMREMHPELSRRASEGAYLLRNVTDAANPGVGQRDRQWLALGDDLIKSTLELLELAGRELTFDAVLDGLLALPRSSWDLRHPKDQYKRLLEQAAYNTRPGSPERQLLDAIRRIDGEGIGGSHEGYRESIRGSALTSLRHLITPPLAGTLGAEKPTFSPRDVLGGRILIVDFGEGRASRIGLVALKTAVQRALLERQRLEGEKTRDERRPVFILADEAQTIVTSGDEQFTARARNARGITFYISHGLSSYEREIGVEQTQVLLGTIRTHVLFSTEDEKTARWFAEGANQPIHEGHWPQDARHVVNVVTEAARTLRQGGAENGWTADALMTCAGRTFTASGKRWLKVSFRQDLPEAGPGAVRYLPARFRESAARVYAKYLTNNVRIPPDEA